LIPTPDRLNHLHRWDAPAAPINDDVCRRQLQEAEREIGAYFRAVAELFGAGAAARAAECWIDLLETTDLPVFDGLRNWREITVLAASRLAMEEEMREGSAMQRTNNESPAGEVRHNGQRRA